MAGPAQTQAPQQQEAGCVGWLILLVAGMTLYVAHSLMGYLGVVWLLLLPASFVQVFGLRVDPLIANFGQMALPITIGMTPTCLFLALYNGLGAVDPNALGWLGSTISVYDFAIVEIYDYSRPLEDIRWYWWAIAIVATAVASWHLRRPSVFNRVMLIKNVALSIISAVVVSASLGLTTQASDTVWNPNIDTRLKAEIRLTIEHSALLNLAQVTAASFHANPQQPTQILGYVQAFVDARAAITSAPANGVSAQDIDTAETSTMATLVSSTFGSDVELPNLPSASTYSLYDNIRHFYQLKASNGELSEKAKLAQQAAVEALVQILPLPQTSIPLATEIVSTILSTSAEWLANQLMTRLPVEQLIGNAPTIATVVGQAINSRFDLVAAMFNPSSAEAPNKAALQALVGKTASDDAKLRIAKQAEIDRQAIIDRSRGGFDEAR